MSCYARRTVSGRRSPRLPALLGLLSVALLGAAALPPEEAKTPTLAPDLGARRLAAIGTPVTTGAAPGFVDDAACASCHPAIPATYREKGMARAFQKPRPANDIEDF